MGRIDGTRGLADTIIMGPNLTKARLNIDRSLVEQWVKEAPLKASLWSAKEKRRLPTMLVVLEEWISPVWAYVASDEKVANPGSSAAGLVATIEGQVPEWLHLAIPNETLTVAYRCGNTAVDIRENKTDCRQRRIGL
jgi:hypothetical protein